MLVELVALVSELDNVFEEREMKLELLVGASLDSLVVEISLKVEDKAGKDDKLIDVLAVDVPVDEVVSLMLTEELVVSADAVLRLVVVKLVVLVDSEDIELSLVVAVLPVGWAILVVVEVERLSLVVVIVVEVLVLIECDVDELILVVITSVVMVVLVSVTELIMSEEDEVLGDELSSLLCIEVELLGNVVLADVLVQDPSALVVEIEITVDDVETVCNSVEVDRLVDRLLSSAVVDICKLVEVDNSTEVV